MAANARLPIRMAIGDSEPQEVGIVEIPVTKTKPPESHRAARRILAEALRVLADEFEADEEVTPS